MAVRPGSHVWERIDNDGLVEFAWGPTNDKVLRHAKVIVAADAPDGHPSAARGGKPDGGGTK